jgi:hypothetical protein
MVHISCSRLSPMLQRQTMKHLILSNAPFYLTLTTAAVNSRHWKYQNQHHLQMLSPAPYVSWRLIASKDAPYSFCLLPLGKWWRHLSSIYSAKFTLHNTIWFGSFELPLSADFTRQCNNKLMYCSVLAGSEKNNSKKNQIFRKLICSKKKLHGEKENSG